MPIITFKNINEEVIQAASEKLPELLSMSMSVPVERIKFENSGSTFYKAGCREEDYCLINVKMVDKGDQVRSVVTTILTEFIKSESGINCSIFYEHVDKSLYFINGNRFDQQ